MGEVEIPTMSNNISTILMISHESQSAKAGQLQLVS